MTPDELIEARAKKRAFQTYPARPKWRVRHPSKYSESREFARDVYLERGSGPSRISIYEDFGHWRPFSPPSVKVYGPGMEYCCAAVEEAFDYVEAWLTANEYTPRPRAPNGSVRPSLAILDAISAALSSAIAGAAFDGLSREDFEKAAIWIARQRDK